MNNTVKAFSLILTFFLILSVCILGLAALNSGVLNEIAVDGNSVVLDESFERKLYKVDGLTPENAKSVILTIDYAESVEPYSILIDHLAFVHEIFLDGVLVSQNADSNGEKYNGGYAYKVYDLNAFPVVGDKITLQVKGTGVLGIDFYLAHSRILHDRVEIRIICSTVMLLLMILMTLTAVLWYIKKRSARFFLVFALIGAVSVIKAVCMGELSVVAGALGFSAKNYTVWNPVLSSVNLFLPLAVMIYLLKLKIGRKLNMALLALGVGLTALNGIVGNPSLFYLFMTIAVYITALALSVFGCIKGKRYCMVIFINNAIYSALVIYAFLINAGILHSGGLDFYVYPAYVGAEIYLLLFFTVFIKGFFREHKKLEAKKKEYERITLLRGIGHDLKLPLSVIKMNNQMLATYDMTLDERRECAGLSSEAALELEKMTDNINSFLNLQAFTDEAYSASLRGSFDKVARRYSALSEAEGYSFSALWEGNDTVLSINPLQLERMLSNLLDNALKYNQKGGNILLFCLVESKKVLLTVQDNGPGMEKQQVERIFEPFYRADNSRARDGLGLGLAVVKGVIDSLNGQIKVESEPGKGTKITVSLSLE
ncbi:MAG: HAMP domain-containing sensor histidine kinase [Oscillospiraceae bacterium]|nr:HAMP domain-containing sensor histidine kinase [Oscillospiraceae bacterium]